jgi:hypothetical protein
MPKSECRAERWPVRRIPSRRPIRSFRTGNTTAGTAVVVDANDACGSDVRRMLLTQRAFAEGGRAMLYEAAVIADGIYQPDATPDDIKKVENWLGVFTPVLKGFLTEVGQEAASLGMQTWGGHGYIVENGMEQVRTRRCCCKALDGC